MRKLVLTQTLGINWMQDLHRDTRCKQNLQQHPVVPHFMPMVSRILTEQRDREEGPGERTSRSNLARMPEGLLQRRSPLAVDTKADTSPVTEADRQAEAAMKALIHESFPAHDMFGEESGMEPGKQPEDNTDPKYLWVIDPIDGTKSFITGVAAPTEDCQAGVGTMQEARFLLKVEAIPVPL